MKNGTGQEQDSENKDKNNNYRNNISFIKQHQNSQPKLHNTETAMRLGIVIQTHWIKWCYTDWSSFDTQNNLFKKEIPFFQNSQSIH